MNRYTFRLHIRDTPFLQESLASSGTGTAAAAARRRHIKTFVTPSPDPYLSAAVLDDMALMRVTNGPAGGGGGSGSDLNIELKEDSDQPPVFTYFKFPRLR